jgi:hypothetical protein
MDQEQKQRDLVFVFRYLESFGNYTITVFAVREKARARVGLLNLTHDEMIELKHALEGKQVLFIAQGRGESK